MITTKKEYLFKNLLAVFISIIHIIPVYIALTMSFKSSEDFSSRWFFPITNFTLSNFKQGFEDSSMINAFFNTVIVTVGTVFFTVVISALAAYPLSRRPTKINKLILIFVVIMMIVPPLSLIVPIYSMFSSLNLTNSYLGTIIVQTTFNLPLGIFLYTNFIKTIPKDLDDAAKLDGCSDIQVFFKVILPILKATTVTVVILVGVPIWNDYIFASYFMQQQEMHTVILEVNTFLRGNVADFNTAAAMTLFAVAPILIAYIFLNKYFINGATEGAVK